MSLDEERPLTVKIFQYMWKQLVRDGYLSEKNLDARESLLQWFKHQYKERGSLPRYHEMVLYISGM